MPFTQSNNFEADPAPATRPDVAPGSPLASVNWNNGKEIRLYFIDDHNIVQEFCYSGGSWVQGSTGKLGVQAAAGSALTAHMFKGSDGSTHIRVYCQMMKQSQLYIQELCYDQGRGWTLSAALTP